MLIISPLNPAKIWGALTCTGRGAETLWAGIGALLYQL